MANVANWLLVAPISWAFAARGPVMVPSKKAMSCLIRLSNMTWCDLRGTSKRLPFMTNPLVTCCFPLLNHPLVVDDAEPNITCTLRISQTKLDEKYVGQVSVRTSQVILRRVSAARHISNIHSNDSNGTSSPIWKSMASQVILQNMTFHGTLFHGTFPVTMDGSQIFQRNPLNDAPENPWPQAMNRSNTKPSYFILGKRGITLPWANKHSSGKLLFIVT